MNAMAILRPGRSSGSVLPKAYMGRILDGIARCRQSTLGLWSVCGALALQKRPSGKDSIGRFFRRRIVLVAVASSLAVEGSCATANGPNNHLARRRLSEVTENGVAMHLGVNHTHETDNREENQDEKRVDRALWL